MTYWRVEAYKGQKQHYAETRDGEPYERAVCGSHWFKKIGPVGEPQANDCVRCREFIDRARTAAVRPSEEIN